MAAASPAGSRALASRRRSGTALYGHGQLLLRPPYPCPYPCWSPKGFGAGHGSCHQRHSKPGSERVAGEADISQTGSGEHRGTLGVLALIFHCQAAPSPGVSGPRSRPGRRVRTISPNRSGAEERSPVSLSLSLSPSPPSRRAQTPQRGVGRPPGVAAEGTRAGGRAVACGDVAPPRV